MIAHTIRVIREIRGVCWLAVGSYRSSAFKNDRIAC
jgi:hypothetical protein